MEPLVEAIASSSKDATSRSLKLLGARSFLGNCFTCSNKKLLGGGHCN